MADITAFTGGASALQSLAEGIADVSAAAPAVTSGGIDLAKLGKSDGEWSRGQEDTPVTDGSKWAVLANTFAAGFISWKASAVEAEVMSTAGEPQVDPQDLPPVTGPYGWQPQTGFICVCIESPDEEDVGAVMAYKQNSAGGLEAVAKLRSAVTARIKAGNGDPFPVIQLGNSSYNHKEWGLTYKPVFSIAEWETAEALLADFKDEIEGVTLTSSKLPNAGPKHIEKAQRRAPRQVENKAPEKVEPEGVEDADVLDETPAPSRRRRAAAPEAEPAPAAPTRRRRAPAE